MSSLDSFASILGQLWPRARGRGGGRKPTVSDEIDSEASTGSAEADALGQPLYLQPLRQGEQSRLTIVQITDVYTLDNFASLKTFLKIIREAQGENDSNR